MLRQSHSPRCVHGSERVIGLAKPTAADVQRVRDGELLLMDAGCELHGYCSDVTRTWPVNGTYSKHQRAIYEIVLDAQRCLLLAERPVHCALPSPASDPSFTACSARASNAWKAYFNEACKMS